MSNRKILSNTVALYFRLLITLFVSLFTTRIVLKNLGIEDYGLYGTVGSLIALIAFLQNALTGATNRFFNIEMISRDLPNIRKLFHTSFAIHLGIAITICLFLEILGKFLLKYYIHIPNEKFAIANDVFNLSVVSLFIIIVTIPFEALLIAKENFKAYAFISIFESLTKLVIAYLLILTSENRLIYYASALLVSTVLSRLIYISITKNLYKEVSLTAGIDKNFLKQISSFIGWDLYGNFAVILRDHGTTLIMNNFFGLLMVASMQIGNQIMAAVGSFANNISLAIKPQMMQSYAVNDSYRMNKLINYSSSFSYYLLLILCVPVIVNIDYILKLWLSTPPKYAKVITIFILCNFMITVIFNPLISLIHATGNIKSISLITGSIILLTLPIIYLTFKAGYPYYWAYIILIMVNILVSLANLLIAAKQVNTFNIYNFLSAVVLKLVTVTLVVGSVLYPFIYVFKANNFLEFVLLSFGQVIIILSFIYILGITKSEKKILISYFNSRLPKK